MLNVGNTRVVKVPPSMADAANRILFSKCYYVSDALLGAKDAPVELKDAILTVT